VKKIQVLSSFKRHAINGFTLVELLIVVIILAILAAIVVPQFASTTDDAKSAAAKGTLANLRAAIDLYYQQHGAYPGAATSTTTATCGGTTGTAALGTKEAFQYQLSLYSKANGETCSVGDTTNFKFGPYMKKALLPPDPFADVTGVEISTSGDLNMVATVASLGGWKYDIKSGKIIINLTAYQGL
jgi:prepilin-type N-terminal cleavage/methylation domain-containing protein